MCGLKSRPTKSLKVKNVPQNVNVFRYSKKGKITGKYVGKGNIELFALVLSDLLKS